MLICAIRRKIMNFIQFVSEKKDLNGKRMWRAAIALTVPIEKFKIALTVPSAVPEMKWKFGCKLLFLCISQTYHEYCSVNKAVDVAHIHFLVAYLPKNLDNVGSSTLW